MRAILATLVSLVLPHPMPKSFHVWREKRPALRAAARVSTSTAAPRARIRTRVRIHRAAAIRRGSVIAGPTFSQNRAARGGQADRRPRRRRSDWRYLADA